MNEEEKHLLEIEEEIRTGTDPRAAVIGYIDELYEKNTADLLQGKSPVTARENPEGAPAAEEKTLEEKHAQDPTAPAYFIPNRHDRRRAAAEARRARREKLKKHGHTHYLVNRNPAHPAAGWGTGAVHAVVPRRAG